MRVIRPGVGVLGRPLRSCRIQREEHVVPTAALLTLTLILTSLSRLTRLLAFPAANRKRQSTQACLRDLLAALEAVAVRPLVESLQRDVELLKRFRTHSRQLTSDMILKLSFSPFARVHDSALALFTTLPFLVADLGHQLAPTVFEHLLELSVAGAFGLPAGLRGHRNCNLLLHVCLPMNVLPEIRTDV